MSRPPNARSGAAALVVLHEATALGAYFCSDPGGTLRAPTPTASPPPVAPTEDLSPTRTSGVGVAASWGTTRPRVKYNRGPPRPSGEAVKSSSEPGTR